MRWHILEVSRQANPAAHITGALFADTTFFAQVLEGRSEQVEDLYAIIIRDSRHFDVVALERVVVADRLFQRSSMGFGSLNCDPSPDADRILEDAYRTREHAATTQVRTLIRESIAELPIS